MLVDDYAIDIVNASFLSKCSIRHTLLLFEGPTVSNRIFYENHNFVESVANMPRRSHPCVCLSSTALPGATNWAENLINTGLRMPAPWFGREAAPVYFSKGKMPNFSSRLSTGFPSQINMNT